MLEIFENMFSTCIKCYNVLLAKVSQLNVTTVRMLCRDKDRHWLCHIVKWAFSTDDHLSADSFPLNCFLYEAMRLCFLPVDISSTKECQSEKLRWSWNCSYFYEKGEKVVQVETATKWRFPFLTWCEILAPFLSFLVFIFSQIEVDQFHSLEQENWMYSSSRTINTFLNWAESEKTWVAGKGKGGH